MKSNSIPTCPCCGVSGPGRAFEVGWRIEDSKPQIATCGTCKHSWLATAESQHRQIEETYRHDYAGHRVDAVFEEKCRIAIAEDISPLVPTPADLLDVGCGNGSFVLAAEEAGYRALGIDISPEGVEFAASRGANAQNLDFLIHDFERKFDVITMWDVVEHLREPASFLVRASELLNADGVLVIKTPSIGEPCLRMVQRFPSLASALLETPDHVQFWTKRSMDALLTRTGFGEVTYWPSRGFRSAALGGSPTKRLKRKVKATLRRYSGNSNLYLSARLGRILQP